MTKKRDINRPKGELKDAFSKTTPTSVHRANGNAEALSQITAIEARAARIKERFRAHYARMQPLWVGREQTKLTAERFGLADPKPKAAFERVVTVQDIARDAQRNVYARAVGRISRINQIKTTLSNAAVRNIDMNPLRPSPLDHNNRKRRKVAHS